MTILNDARYIKQLGAQLNGGVFARWDGKHIVIESTDGTRTTNRITLTDEMSHKLVGYLMKQLGIQKAEL